MLSGSTSVKILNRTGHKKNLVCDIVITKSWTSVPGSKEVFGSEKALQSCPKLRQSNQACVDLY